MYKVCLNVDGIFGELEKRRLITLQHAAEISPFIKDRTLGPDKDVWREEEIKSDDENEPAQVKESPPATAAKLLTPIINGLQSMDLQTISSSVVIREAERKRQEIMRQNLAERQQRQIALRAEQQETRKQMPQRRRNNPRTEDQIQQEAEEQAAKELAQQQQQVEVLRLQTRRELQAISFQGILKYQRIFRAKYENVAKQLIANDRQTLPSCIEHNRKLKEFVQMFEQLINKIKAGECGQAELKMAEQLCRNMDGLQGDMHEELQQQKERQQEEEEAAAVAAAAHAAAAAVVAAAENQAKEEALAAATARAAEVTAAAPTPTGVESSPQFYADILGFYLQKMEAVQPINDDALKGYRFACQKAINIPLNAISAVSPQHLHDKFEKLYSFISGQPVQHGDGQISVNDHPLGRDYCLLLMAKKFVSQGETAISSNPKAAYPVASVVVSLWKRVPEFGKLFLACMFRESPLLVPRAGQEEYGDLKRQAGIARLYGAIMITSGRQADGPGHPYGLDHCWRWFAAFVGIEPQQDISATLLVEMLQVVGADMWQQYGVDEGGPKARLQMLLESYFRQPITRPQGVLPPKFW